MSTSLPIKPPTSRSGWQLNARRRVLSAQVICSRTVLIPTSLRQQHSSSRGLQCSKGRASLPHYIPSSIPSRAWRISPSRAHPPPLRAQPLATSSHSRAIGLPSVPRSTKPHNAAHPCRPQTTTPSSASAATTTHHASATASPKPGATSPPEPTTPAAQPVVPQPPPRACRPPPPPSPPALTTRRTVLGTTAALAAAALAPPPLVLPSPASAAAVSGRPPPELGFESRVEEFTLPNGLHFIVLPRRNAPVVACHTYANVGAWNESPGLTGMAHLLEHMAFKGTPRLGSLDFRREAVLLDALDEAFYELRDAQGAVTAGGPPGTAPGGGSPGISALRTRLRALQDQAVPLTVPDAFGATLQRAGGVGLNAATSHDATRYFVSLPSNKLELWVALEAERFRAPVFRELYQEKAVIEEERQMRVENSPMGRYQQQFALASLANNYRRPVIGFEGDFDSIGRREVQAYFNQYYGPANLTIAIVGDADPRVVQRMAERYWGDWRGPEGYTVLPRGQPLGGTPRTGGSSSGSSSSGSSNGSGGNSLAVTAAAGARGRRGDGSGAAAAAAAAVAGGGWGLGEEEDPRPEAFRSGRLTSLEGSARSGPAALLGFYRPALPTRRGVALAVLADVLTDGRTSRLVSELVLTGRALSASMVVPYPGERHAGLTLLYGVPREGDSPEDVASLLQTQLTALAEGGVAAGELARVQRSARAGLLGAAQSNTAMAGALAAYHVNTGSWRGLVEELDLVTQLRGAELRDVAEAVFAPGNCFTGLVRRA